MPKIAKSKEHSKDMKMDESCNCGGNCGCGGYGCGGYGWKYKHHGAGAGIYWLGFAGSAIYYLQNATSFGAGVLGILKSLVWPAMIVFKTLQFLKL